MALEGLVAVMNQYVEYPPAMRLEALQVIAASEAQPGTETAMLIYEFIERSREHEACLIWHLKLIAFLRKHIAQSSQRSGLDDDDDGGGGRPTLAQIVRTLILRAIPS